MNGVAVACNCSAGALGYCGKNTRNYGGVVAHAWWGSSAERRLGVGVRVRVDGGGSDGGDRRRVWGGLLVGRL
jgi:hypothetical protein